MTSKPCLHTRTTTGELRFAVQQERTAKAKIRSAKPLPCGLARQRLLGNEPPGKAVFAVRRAEEARQRPLPCALALPCAGTALPCECGCRALSVCRAAGFAVCSAPIPHGKVSSLPCASTSPRTAKMLQQNCHSRAVHSRATFAVCMCTAKAFFAVCMCLCRVHMHGKGAEKIPDFFCFSLIPAYTIHKYKYISRSIYSITYRVFAHHQQQSSYII
jgi:hypothetical protein